MCRQEVTEIVGDAGASHPLTLEPNADNLQQQLQESVTRQQQQMETVLLIGPSRDILWPIMRKLVMENRVPAHLSVPFSSSRERHIYLQGKIVRLVYIDTSHEVQRSDIVSRVQQYNPIFIMMCEHLNNLQRFEKMWDLDRNVLDELDVEVMWVLVQSFSSPLSGLKAWIRAHVFKTDPVIKDADIQLAQNSLRSQRDCVVVSFSRAHRFMRGGVGVGIGAAAGSQAYVRRSFNALAAAIQQRFEGRPAQDERFGVVEEGSPGSNISQGDGTVPSEQQPVESARASLQSIDNRGDGHSDIVGIVEDDSNNNSTVDGNRVEVRPIDTGDLNVMQEVEEDNAQVTETVDSAYGDESDAENMTTPSNADTMARPLLASRSRVRSAWDGFVRGLRFRSVDEQQQRRDGMAEVGQDEPPQYMPNVRQQRRFIWRRGVSRWRRAGGRQ